MKLFMHILGLLLLSSYLYGQSAGDYFIQSAVGGKYLNVRGAKSDNGTQIQIYHYANGQTNEKFSLEDAGSGYFYIKSHLGKYIHVQNRSAEPKAMALLWAGKGNDNTKWKFKSAGNGYYYIQSKKGTYLDVQWGTDKDMTPVWLWTYNGGDAQKWKLQEIKYELRDQKISKSFFLSELCPNTKDGHLVSGNRHLDGEVEFEIKGDIYFEKDKSELFVDIELNQRSLGTGSVIKANWSRLSFYKAPTGHTIEAFYYECGSRGFDGIFNHKKCSFPMFEGRKNFNVSGKLPPGGEEIKPFSYNDGTRKTFQLNGDPFLLSKITLIGDTGSEDISDDRNCEHDSKIVGIFPVGSRSSGSWHVSLKKATAIENNQRRISVSLGNLKNKIHNGDCERMQGSISINLIDKETKRKIQSISSSNVLMSLTGHKIRDFERRTLNLGKYQSVEFNVDERKFRDGNLSIELSSNIKGCHKNCDLCSDYHCNLSYKNVSFPHRGLINRWNVNNKGQMHSTFGISASDPNKHLLTGEILIK